MSETSTVETTFEQGLFASRWLMAPMYLGLAVTLGMLTMIFVKELVYYLPQVLELTAEKMILVALTMIDLTLAANLLLIHLTFVVSGVLMALMDWLQARSNK